ncbi:MAG: peptidase S45, penicillin amidase, partial [uncultured Solirubrobacteraceae bacterium]
ASHPPPGFRLRPAHRAGRLGRLRRRHPPHGARDPAHPREGLRVARLRLRLRVRAGQRLHDGRLLRHRPRGALALLRAGRQVRVPRQRDGAQQPQVRLLLQADHRREDGREADRRARPARAEGRHPRGGARLRRRLQPLPRRDPGRPDPRPRVPGPGVGQADRGDRRLPPLLPARAARLGGRGDRRHRRGAAAHAARDRRRRRGRAGPVQGPRVDRPQALRRDPRRHRLERRGVRQGLHRERARPAARQPALPVGRLRALLPVAADHPRQDGRRGREPVRRADRAHRPHAEHGLEPHGLDRPPLHAVRAQARPRLVHHLPGRRAAQGDEADEGDRHGQGRRRQARGALAHPVLVRARPDPHLAAGHPAVPVDDEHRLRARRRQRDELPLPQPLLRHEHGPERRRARRDRAQVPGHPVGQHDRRRLRRQGLLRRHRRGAERRQRQDRELQRAARPRDRRRPARPGARRGARGLWLRQRGGQGRGRAGHPAALADAVAVPRRLRSQCQRLLLADEPEGAARGLPAHHRRRAHRARPAHAARAEDHRGGREVRAAGAPGCGLQQPPVPRRAVARRARRPVPPGAGRARRRVRRAREVGPPRRRRVARRAALPPLRDSRGQRPGRPVPDPVLAAGPGEHAARAQHGEPGRAPGAARRDRRPQRRRHPVRRPAGRLPVREARRGEGADPRWPRHARRVERDQRRVGPQAGLPERPARVELRAGRRLRRQPVPRRPHDPHLLAVGEPGVAAVRRPDADVLPQGVGQEPLLRARHPGRSGSADHEADLGRRDAGHAGGEARPAAAVGPRAPRPLRPGLVPPGQARPRHRDDDPRRQARHLGAADAEGRQAAHRGPRAAAARHVPGADQRGRGLRAGDGPAHGAPGGAL